MRTLALRSPQMRGDDVRLMQRRLPGLSVDGVYGPGTAAVVYAWKWRVGFPAAAVNTGLGPQGQLILLGKAPLTDAMHALARQRSGKEPPQLTLPPPKQASLRELVCNEMHYLLDHRNEYTYVQHRPMPPSIESPEARHELDCSSTATLAYKGAGAPDPNGLDYNGYGYTGTLVAHGQWTTNPRPGDLAFYGNMGNGIPSHVAVHDEDPSYVISFGHTPPTRYPFRYRTDYRGSKTYLP